MPYQAMAFRVLIATPGDVTEERQLIRDAISDWNSSGRQPTWVKIKNRSIHGAERGMAGSLTLTPESFAGRCRDCLCQQSGHA